MSMGHPRLCAFLTLVLLGGLVAHARQSPVRVLDTPAGPGSGMYALTGGDTSTTMQAGPREDASLVLSWIDPLPEGGHALRFATFEGTSWTAAREVARGTDWFANWADHPSVVRLGDGSLLAHWLVRSGDGSSTYGYGLRIAQSGDEGRTWAEILRDVPADTKDYAGFAAFSPVRPGHGVAYLAPKSRYTPGVAPAAGAAHGDHHESGKALVFASLDPAVAVPPVVLDPDVCDCCRLAMTSTSQGRIVAYRDHKPGEVRDISVVRSHAAGWTAPRTVHEDGWVIPGCPTNGPAIAADGDLVVVAWFTAAGGTPRVRVAFSSDAGDSFGPPVDVDGGAPIGWAGVVLTPEREAVVSWLESQPGGGAQVRARRIRDGRMGTPLTIAAAAGGRATGIPNIARSGAHLVFAWRDGRVRTAVVPLADIPELPS
jgi:hypothetical protein